MTFLEFVDAIELMCILNQSKEKRKDQERIKNFLKEFFNTLTIMHPCLAPQIFHTHCFQFLLGITVALREIKNNGYEKFWGVSKLNSVLYGNAEQLFLV